MQLRLQVLLQKHDHKNGWVYDLGCHGEFSFSPAAVPQWRNFSLLFFPFDSSFYTFFVFYPSTAPTPYLNFFLAAPELCIALIHRKDVGYCSSTPLLKKVHFQRFRSSRIFCWEIGRYFFPQFTSYTPASLLISSRSRVHSLDLRSTLVKFE